MPSKSGCCCPQHSEWGFGNVGIKQVLAATNCEEKFCGGGKWSTSGHEERNRKICTFCRERIKLQTSLNENLLNGLTK